MSSTQLCLHYANNESEWPTLQGKKVSVLLSKKSKNKVKKPKKKSTTLKIYDGECEQTDVPEAPKKADENTKIEKSESADESESNVEDDVEDDSEEDEVDDEEEEEEDEESSESE